MTQAPDKTRKLAASMRNHTEAQTRSRSSSNSIGRSAAMYTTHAACRSTDNTDNTCGRSCGYFHTTKLPTPVAATCSSNPPAACAGSSAAWCSATLMRSSTLRRDLPSACQLSAAASSAARRLSLTKPGKNLEPAAVMTVSYIQAQAWGQFRPASSAAAELGALLPHHIKVGTGSAAVWIGQLSAQTFVPPCTAACITTIFADTVWFKCLYRSPATLQCV